MSDMIRPHVRDGAHQVRLFGNDMAHGDFVRDVSPEDADLVLTLMSEVLDDVYQSPARVKRAQMSRQCSCPHARRCSRCTRAQWAPSSGGHEPGPALPGSGRGRSGTRSGTTC
jgi:hypothetical protein